MPSLTVHVHDRVKWPLLTTVRYSLLLTYGNSSHAILSTQLEIDDNLKHWKYVMSFMLANVVACVVCALLLNIHDARSVRVLS